MADYLRDFAMRPGRVTTIGGIILQSDGQSSIGRMFIRPLEALDRAVVGILPRPGDPALAIHAGIRLTIDGTTEYVAEQLVGSFYLDFENGLNWTPLDKFRQRDRGGWDVTIPGPAFRRIDEAALADTIARLNAIDGHPFVGEDCTAFIERAFGNRRMFADSPLLRWLGVGARIGDPALPLLERDAPLDAEAKKLLQFDNIKDLPDALADAESPNVRAWIVRLLGAALVGALFGRAYSSSSRKSTPASRTARRFLR
ncbi:MAG: hypothetical protein LC797_02345 [Chloroflexi bacterium]|nr:hypothetical protein [Chloroflexota bacterium]